MLVSLLIYLPTEEDNESAASSAADNALPLKPGVPPSAVTDVSRLDALLRVEVMMLELMGGHSSQHRMRCLQALGYCQLLWKVGAVV